MVADTNTDTTTKKMVTVCMYSYKGGVGRTLLVGQIARLLAAFGKTVVIADFDFDAPGIPALFGFKGKELDFSGFFELFREHRNAVEPINLQTELKWHSIIDEDEDADVKERRVYDNMGRSLQQKLRCVKDIKLRGYNNLGSINILQSGAFNRDYLDYLSSGTWHESFGADAHKNGSVRHFIKRAFKPALERMGVDYLLIDSRAGLNNYSRVSREVSNRHIILVPPGPEGEVALDRFILNELTDNTDYLESAAIVLSRVPPEFRENAEKAMTSLKEVVLPKINEKYKEITECYVLASDIKTQYNPSTVFFDNRYLTEGAHSIVQLHEDYLVLFATLFPEISEVQRNNKKPLEAAHEIWKNIYGYKFNITNINRLYEYDATDGKMINPDDNNPNVSFRVSTFNIIVKNLVATLKNDDLVEALKNAGKDCGERFGNSLAAKHITLCNDEKVKSWCEFDMRAGFGKLEYDITKKTLNVGNLFLVDEYTALFTKYASTVISTLTNGIYKLIDEDKKAVSGSIEYKIKVGD